MKNKYRFLIIIIICLFTAFFLVQNASAGTEDSYKDSHENNSDAISAAESILDEYSLENVWNGFIESLKETFFAYSKKFYLLIFITLMLGILNVVCDTTAAVYAGEICLCTYAFSVVTVICENVTFLMNAINNFVLSLLPTMTALYTSSVGVATASTSHTSTTVLLGVCSTMFSAVLLPSVKAIMIFACVTLISKSFNFSGFSNCIKSIVAWLFGAAMCVMSAVIYFQSVITVSKDGLTSRTVRYAAQSLIPVIGSVVSESARTLSESLRLVRGVTGVSGIFAIIGIIASPICALIVCKLFVALCSSLARLLGCSGASLFYNEIGGAMNLLLGACIGVSIVFILILGIFAKASVQV